MYDELVKRLRICPDYNDGCVSCPHEHDLGCRSATMREAADAIEALSRENESLAKTAQEASEALRQRRPVVRGKWEWTVEDDDPLGEFWKCNLCGERSYIGYNFCPNCGADMKGEAE